MLTLLQGRGGGLQVQRDVRRWFSARSGLCGVGWGALDNIYIHIYVAAEFGSSHTYSVPRLIEFRVHVVSKKSKRCI